MDLSGRVTGSTLDDGDSTFVYEYQYSADGREEKVTAHGKASGTSTTEYDVNDRIVVVNKGKGDGAQRDEVLKFLHNNEDQILFKSHDQGKDDTNVTETQYLYANGNPVGEFGTDAEVNGKINVEIDTGPYSLVEDIGGNFPTPSISSYTTSAGDTLQSIALSLFGNASLWFVLADANGLDISAPLDAGTRITVPNRVESGRLTADAHVLYSQGEIVGSTLPNLKSPPPKKANGCVQILVIVLVVIVAVVAAIFTAGIGGAIVGAAGAGLLATLGALAIAGAVGAAIALAANAITQGIYIAFGMQKEFNWGSFAVAGAAGFLSGVAGGLGGAAQAAAKAGETLTYTKIAIPLLRVGAAALQQMGTDADGNGKPDMKITSWVGLAAAGVGGALEGFSPDLQAADNAVKASKTATDVALSAGTIDTIRAVVDYATPWAQLAESYIRRDPNQEFDWLSAVGTAVASNLVSAVNGPLQRSLGTDNSFADRLAKAFVNTTINAMTAGVMSSFDQDAGMGFLISSVGNEVGQLAGGVLTIDTGLKESLDRFSEKQLDKLAAEYASREERSSVTEVQQQTVTQARTAPTQQEAAVTEQSVSEEVAGYVSTSEMPEEGTQSAAAEPEVPTITNKDGEEVPINSVTVDADGGTMYPWTFAKKLADARAMELRGKPATDVEISRTYRLLVELNGDEVDFRKPLEDGVTLKSVNFDDNVAVSPQVNQFVEGQAQAYYQQKARNEAKRQLAKVREEFAAQLGVQKDLLSGTAAGAGDANEKAQELQSLLQSSITAKAFTVDDRGVRTVSAEGLDRLKAAGVNLEGVTFSVKSDDSGNVTVGIVKNGNAIALTETSDGVNLSVLAGDNVFSATSPKLFDNYSEGAGSAPAETKVDAALEAPTTPAASGGFDPISDAMDWVGGKVKDYRSWNDTYQPESVGGHVVDALGTFGAGVLDLGEFAYNVNRTSSDLSVSGFALDQLESVTGTDLPDWLPSANRGRQSLQSAGSAVVNIAENPVLIWDGLTENYVKLWGEERYGGLVGQVAADFGDVLLGSKGAGKAAGVASDLARVGNKLGEVADVAKVADAVNAAPVLKISDAANVALVPNSADDMVTVYRGTSRYAENQIFDETGHILSDAAQRSYMERGGLSDAYSTSRSTHDQWIDIWGNETHYAEAHAAFGTELKQAFNLDRTFVSVTTDPDVAKYFSKGGTVYSGQVPRSHLIQQTLQGSTESEWLLRNGSDLLKRLSP